MAKKAKPWKTSQAKPRQVKPFHAIPSQAKPSQAKPSQVKPSEGKARQGKARQGKARQGKERKGKARQGKARRGKAMKQAGRQVGRTPAKSRTTWESVSASPSQVRGARVSLIVDAVAAASLPPLPSVSKNEK